MAQDEEYHIHRLPNHASGEGRIKVLQNKTRARNEVDKLDNEYGGYAHTMRTVAKQAEASRMAGKGSIDPVYPDSHKNK